MRERFNPQVATEGLDMLSRDMGRRWRARSQQGHEVRLAHVLLCADICEEFREAGLRIQPRREQQGTRAILLATEFRIGTALLEEDGHYLEGILCQRLLRAKRPRREQQDIETGRKEVRTSGGYTSGPAGGMWRTRASRYRLIAISV